jgi:hypothetical protein
MVIKGLVSTLVSWEPVITIVRACSFHLWDRRFTGNVDRVGWDYPPTWPFHHSYAPWSDMSHKVAARGALRKPSTRSGWATSLVILLISQLQVKMIKCTLYSIKRTLFSHSDNCRLTTICCTIMLSWNQCILMFLTFDIFEVATWWLLRCWEQMSLVFQRRPWWLYYDEKMSSQYVSCWHSNTRSCSEKEVWWKTWIRHQLFLHDCRRGLYHTACLITCFSCLPVCLFLLLFILCVLLVFLFVFLFANMIVCLFVLLLFIFSLFFLLVVFCVCLVLLVCHVGWLFACP